MELRGATVLLLGGSGLVGTATARRLLGFSPRRIIVTGLTADEVRLSLEELAADAGSCILEGAHGNVFHPADLAQLPRGEVESNAAIRRRLVDELFGPLTEKSYSGNLLFSWLQTYRPDAVVDCINTATALAYRDVYASSAALLHGADGGTLDTEAVERHLLTLELPQLIRHVQILSEGMRRAGVQAYVKIGTSGTGGMGLNIPYTHSEERPSRTLMTKSAVAGAHSMFMFLLGRTPNAPAIIEIKPTAAIGWREIAYGPVRRAGKAINLVDCTRPLPLSTAFGEHASGWNETGEKLENAYINLGENGMFAHDEFATVTALGQMELLTAEEIAEVVVLELSGRPTGKDIVAALDGASLGPSYRAGVLREEALRGLRALEADKGVRSVAFEMLGPPRLTKLLFEAFVLGRLFGSMAELARAGAEAAGRDADRLLLEADPALRRQIISVGIPILLSDGRSVLRGAHVAVPPQAGGAVDETAARGWVDLRVQNMRTWISRAERIGREPAVRGSGSFARWDAMDAGSAIVPSSLAVWIFHHEDGGFRIKR